MKNKWKWMTGLLIAGFCMVSMTLPAAAYQEEKADNIWLCDEANSLTEDEFDYLVTCLQDTSDYTGMNIGVWVGGEPLGYGEESTIRFCDDNYDQQFGINTDGVFLYIDMSGESDLFDYLSTSGMGQFYYTNSDDNNRVHEMIVGIESHLPRGNEDVSQAIIRLCTDMELYYDVGVPEGYYTYNSDNGEYLYSENGKVKSVYQYEDLPEECRNPASWGSIILTAVVAGILAFVISLLVIRFRYRFKSPGDMRNYLESGRVRMTFQEDRFLRQSRTRTRIESSSGGGGGGGGGSSHSSSGGGSHGGGGGHR